MIECEWDWAEDEASTPAEPSPELLAIWDDQPALALALDTFTIHASFTLDGRPVALMEALDALQWIGDRLVSPARGTLFLAERQANDWHPVKVLSIKQARAWLDRHGLDCPRWLQRGGGPNPLDSLLCSLASSLHQPIKEWAGNLLCRGEFSAA